jgi:hypothetical protein
MQFKPDRRTATPVNSAAGGLRQLMSLAGTAFRLNR